MPRTQVERREATQAALVASARRLFAEHGFAGVTRDEIAEAAGVTRGALYHHFASKEALFRVVVEELERELVAGVAEVASASGDDARVQLRAGCLAFLDACLDPEVRRIVLLEAPAVLGWVTWREIDTRHGLAILTLGLNEALAENRLPSGEIRTLAHLLLAALNEAAQLVAVASDPGAARREVGATVERLLDRLLV